MRIQRLLPLLAVCLFAGHANAFSQSSPVTPVGHEWLTVAPALELLQQPLDQEQMSFSEGLQIKGEETEKPSPALLALLARYQTEGPKLTKAEADLLTGPKGTLAGDKYGAKYYTIWSAVMGQRWVDIGGFRITAPKGKKCWDAITQAQAHVQASHFLREFTEEGGAGALHAIKRAQGRLQLQFIAAAMAKNGNITFWDGGAASTRKVASRPFFLFGRVVHLFQDSFSPEHGARDEADGYRTITAIKSYVCTKDSAQHTHDAPITAKHGDVIWKKRASADWSDKNVKPIGVATMRAMRDLWAAFLRARAAPEQDRQKVASDEIKAVIAQWMSFNETQIKANGEVTQFGKKVSQSFSGAEQQKCIKAVGTAEKADETRKECLTMIGREKDSEFDEDLQIPFNWKNAPRE